MAIEGKTIKSKATGLSGVIDKIENGKLYISFQSMGSIPINLKEYENVIIVDEETKKELSEITDSFKVSSRKESSNKSKNIKRETTKNEILPKSLDLLDAYGERTDFRINIDVLNACFGANVAMWMKATYPAKRNLSVKDSDIEAFIWMPKFYRNISCWKNSMSGDGEYIYEIADYDRKEDWMDSDENRYAESGSEGKYRITFIKETPDSPYRFVGVYEDYKMDHLDHTYRRVCTKIKLIGDPVYEIEFL